VDVLNLTGATLVRFVTPTHDWAAIASHNLCVPDKWPYMLVEFLVAANGPILMSSVIGIPKSSLTALRSQGISLYQFHDLQDVVITAITAHFTRVYKDMLQRADLHIPEHHKSRLTIVTR
jgi:hypothetical protein